MRVIRVKYKEDSYSDMVRNAIFNPFRLTVVPLFNDNLQFMDLVDVFENEFNTAISKALHFGKTVGDVFYGMLFNYIEDYYNKAGFVPKAIVDEIIEQVYEAANRTRYAYLIDDIDMVKYRMYYNLTHP